MTFFFSGAAWAFAQNPRMGLRKNGKWEEESGDAALRGNTRGAGEDETHEDIVPSAGVQEGA